MDTIKIKLYIDPVSLIALTAAVTATVITTAYGVKLAGSAVGSKLLEDRIAEINRTTLAAPVQSG